MACLGGALNPAQSWTWQASWWLPAVATLLAWPAAWEQPASAQIARAAQRSAARAATHAAERSAAERAAARASQSVAAAQARRQVRDTVIRRWSSALCKPARPCPLPDQHANSFRGGSYNEVRLGQDTRLYRAYANPVYRYGNPRDRYSYWSRSSSRDTQAVIDSAIPVSRNGNTAHRQSSITLPRGTRVFEGETRQIRGGPVGGGNQVIVENVGHGG